MTKTIASRPLSTAGGGVNFNTDELQLIAALMYYTKLGFGSRSKYKEAAKTILDKIETIDPDFAESAANIVDPQIEVLDSTGYPIMVLPGNIIQIIV